MENFRLRNSKQSALKLIFLTLKI